MKYFRLITIIIGFNAFQVFGDQPTKESTLTLMKITGAEQMVDLMLNQLMPLVKKAAPNAKEEFWTEFQTQIDPNELIERIVPVYQKHFTQKEIDETIEFYSSETGQKFISLQPNMFQESNAIGEQWAREIVQDVIEKLNEQGS